MNKATQTKLTNGVRAAIRNDKELAEMLEAHTVSKREAQKSLVYFWQWDNRRRSLEWLSSDEGAAFFDKMREERAK